MGKVAPSGSNALDQSPSIEKIDNLTGDKKQQAQDTKSQKEIQREIPSNQDAKQLVNAKQPANALQQADQLRKVYVMERIKKAHKQLEMHSIGNSDSAHGSARSFGDSSASSEIDWTKKWTMAPVSSSMEDVYVPVEQIVKGKFLEEDENGNLFLVGTFVQQILGISPQKEDGSKHFFWYRFNGLCATEDQCQFRKNTERGIKEDGMCFPMLQMVASVRIPLVLENVYSCFPFSVMKASALIELSTFEENNIEFRADFVFPENIDNEPQQIWDFFHIRNKDERECDRMKNFRFVTPNPSISLQCECKKDGETYTSKFEIAFWLVEPVERKLITILLPIFIVLVLGTINVFALQEPQDFIANTASISLTLVFLLPSLSPESAGNRRTAVMLSTNDLAVGLIFGSLILNCIKFCFFTQVSQVETFATFHDAFASGQPVVLIRELILPFLCTMLFLSSMLFPLQNYTYYRKFLKRIAKLNHQEPKNDDEENEKKRGMTSSQPDYARNMPFLRFKQPKQSDDKKKGTRIPLKSKICLKSNTDFGFSC